MPEEVSNHIKQEIAALEEVLREKKRELEVKGELVPSGVEGEKELLKEAVKEHVERAQEVAPAAGRPQVAVPPIDAPGASISQPPQDDPLAGLDHREQIEELAAIAFSKGIVEAVNIARRANNAHLLDEFHDALVDRLYDYLAQEGVITSS